MVKKQINKINFIYILSFLGDALFSPFLALYFSSLNMEETKKGILLALIPFSCIVGSLIYGKLSKKSQRNLLIIRILVMVQLIIMIPFGFVSSYVLLTVFTVVFAMHNSTFFSFQDGIASKISKEENTVYSKTRMFGSIGYLLGTLIGGKLIDLTSFGVVFLIAGLIYAIVELLFFFIKTKEENENGKVEISFKQIFSYKQFIFYLIFYILVMGTWSIQEAYVSLMFKSEGITTSQWGYIFALEILIEALVIYFINKFYKKNNYKIILLIAICLMIFRGITLSLTINTWIKVILSASLRGLAWGLFLSSHMEMVKSILPNELVTKAYLIFLISSNIYATIGDYIAPHIYTNYSYEILYLILFIIQIIGGIIYFISLFLTSKKTQVV